ncbi:MAG TPA: Rrf2 family transcriptional regulator [Chondromyces sp.]|nr:Rrf2 family transcriptional regulator [Chondromyces sp.]
MISKSCKYAIRAVIYLASRSGESVKLGIKEIAKEIDAPEAFSAKILQILTRHKIVSSLKGPYGGFFIEDYQLEQPILNIVNAVDGLQVFTACGLGLKYCSEKKPCPFHYEYKEVRNRMLNTFQKTTIRKLAANLDDGMSLIK